MKTVLILGSGALKVGEAGEFDYSGCQAVKAIKQSGHRVIVLNPNVASTQSNFDFVDMVYSRSVDYKVVEFIIQKEEVCSVLIGFGGQTALNCALDCYSRGIFEKYKVEILGTSIENIIISEDRAKFAQIIKHLSYEHSKYLVIDALQDLESQFKELSYPVFVRSNQSLGGLASKICYDFESIYKHCKTALKFCKSLIIEEYLEGFKEVEYEILRDRYDNCICVCSMENLDPMGIHTGDSIVVAPTQTISDILHQRLRNAAFAIARKLEIIGECNVQFAIDPQGYNFKVIEVNARLSRSSALASKACGYPIAQIAAKLCLGFALWELKNSLNNMLSAVMEPSLDYICVKIPKWEDDRFFEHPIPIGPEMQSIGEVMAIGRTFEEAIQKAIRMIGYNLKDEIVDLSPNSKRLIALINSFRKNVSLDLIHKSTNINPWFLGKIKSLVLLERQLASFEDLNASRLKLAKEGGYSDDQVGELFVCDETNIRTLRKMYDIRPFIKMIDSTSGEHGAQSNYLYHSYHGSKNDVEPLALNESILLIGAGSFKIGSSLEFDWCCSQTLKSLKLLACKSIFVNHNPETLSTDYDQCDRLYFEELSFERIIDIISFEKPFGVIISMCGQVGNDLSHELFKKGVNILGSRDASIQICENRLLFNKHLIKLGVKQAKSFEYVHIENDLEDLKYPVIVRPSKVLSGIDMRVCNNSKDLLCNIKSNSETMLISEFFNNATELDFDGIANKGKIVSFALCEHIEKAGIHSGDSTLVCPPQNLSQEESDKILEIARRLVSSLKITGVFNIQFMIESSNIYVIECNLRASRTIPFVSKALEIDFIGICTSIYLGQQVDGLSHSKTNTIGVKVPQFSLQRMKNIDPNLSPIMRSTGEVAAFSSDYHEALVDAMNAVGYPSKVAKICLICDYYETIVQLGLQKSDFEITCVDKTKSYLEDLQIPYTYCEQKDIPKNLDLLICLSNEPRIKFQRLIIEQGIPIINNIHLAIQYIKALSKV